MPKLRQSDALPRTERPRIEGYGISKSKTGMLPWEWAVKMLTESREYWICTVRSDGRAHAMIIWGFVVRWCVLVRHRQPDPKGTQLGKEPELYRRYSKCRRGGDSGRDGRNRDGCRSQAEVGTCIAPQVWDERRATALSPSIACAHDALLVLSRRLSRRPPRSGRSSKYDRRSEWLLQSDITLTIRAENCKARRVFESKSALSVTWCRPHRVKNCSAVHRSVTAGK
jgi:hypothetical protein